MNIVFLQMDKYPQSYICYLNHASRTGTEYIHYTSVIQGPHKLHLLEKPATPRLGYQVIARPVGWTVAKCSRNPRRFINQTNQTRFAGTAPTPAMDKRIKAVLQVDRVFRLFICVISIMYCKSHESVGDFECVFLGKSTWEPKFNILIWVHKEMHLGRFRSGILQEIIKWRRDLLPPYFLRQMEDWQMSGVSGI